MRSERTHYIYKIFAGDDLLPFYVGVARTPTRESRTRREIAHINEARRGAWKANEPKNLFIRDCLERGVSFRYEYERDLTVEQAYVREIALVKKFGRCDLGTGCLFNACCGGWGSKEQAPSTLAKRRAFRHAEETKARIAASHRGMKPTPETIAKISAAAAKQVRLIGKDNPRFGTGSQVPEAIVAAERTRRHRARKRGEDVPFLPNKRRTGVPMTLDNKMILLEVNRNRVVSAETRAKMSAAAKARKPNFRQPHSEEAKAKMSAAKIGRKLSDETRAAMRVSQVARRAAERGEA